MNILDKIATYKRELIAKQKKEVPLEKLISRLKKPLPLSEFQGRIAEHGVHLIAEVKKASPSVGVIAEDFDPVAVAQAYEQGGAACISVLTEDKFFKGKTSFLESINQAVRLPLLRKDFIIDEYQIYESKLHQADAILLIAAILKDKEMKRFLKIAQTINLDVLLEVHSEEEVLRALDAGAKIIGINTRNLKDFSVDLKLLPRLLKKIPKDKLVVCESGIKTLKDLSFIKKSGVNAVLVGEALLKAADIEAKTREFVDFLND